MLGVEGLVIERRRINCCTKSFSMSRQSEFFLLRFARTSESGISNIPIQLDHTRRNQIAPLVINNAIAVAIAQALFTHAARAGKREDDWLLGFGRLPKGCLHHRRISSRDPGADLALGSGADHPSMGTPAPSLSRKAANTNHATGNHRR